MKVKKYNNYLCKIFDGNRLIFNAVGNQNGFKIDKLTEDDKRLLDSYVNPMDYTDKKNITAIVEFINK